MTFFDDQIEHYYKPKIYKLRDSLAQLEDGTLKLWEGNNLNSMTDSLPDIVAEKRQELGIYEAIVRTRSSSD